jgi:hypothetical protein
MVLSGFLRGNGQASTKEANLPMLTAREREVVQLLAEGKILLYRSGLRKVSSPVEPPSRPLDS